MTQKPVKAQVSCMLKSLANPRLGGVLPCLEITPEEVKPNLADFACCSGKGFVINEEKNITTRCDLNQRLPRVRYLLAKYYKQWGDEATCPSIQLPREIAAGMAERFAAFSEGKKVVGQTILTKNSVVGPSLIWPVSLMAAWRFGLKPYVVNFSSYRKSLLPPNEMREDSSGMIVLVEHIDKLWDEGASAELDALVDWCYKSMVPMWLNFVVRPKTGDKQPAKRSYSRRIENLKAQSPMSWFSDDRLQKLKELCEIPTSLTPRSKTKTNISSNFDIFS